MTDALEIPVRHRHHLGRLVDELAEHARRGVRGERLAEQACAALGQLLSFQIPVASADAADLDARVLLWPIGAKDAQHPHTDGWAVFAAVRGTLAVHERHHGEPQPERAVPLRDPEMLTAIDGITHHLHNRGDEVALSVHVFGT
jgi:hypothetical protein